MKISQKWLVKVNRGLLLWLVTLEVFFVIVYLGRIAIAGKSYPAFDMDGFQTIPSLFAAVQLLCLGLAFLGLSLYRARLFQHPSRRLLLTLGAIFTYIAADETFKVHQFFYLPLCIFPWIADCQRLKSIYLLVYPAIAVALVLTLRRDLLASWRFYRKGSAIAAIGIFTFLFGALGSEIIRYTILQPILLKFVSYDSALFRLVELVRVAFEEFSEMLGVTLTLYSLGLFFGKRLEKEPHSFD